MAEGCLCLEPLGHAPPHACLIKVPWLCGAVWIGAEGTRGYWMMRPPFPGSIPPGPAVVRLLAEAIEWLDRGRFPDV